MFILIVGVVLVLFTLFVLFENAKFQQACDKGDLEFVKTKLNKLNCISVNSVSMQKAIKSDNIELVEYLIKYVDLKESEYLNTACQYHHKSIVKLLIEKGATLDFHTYNIERFLESNFNKELCKLYITANDFVPKEMLLNIAENKEFDLIKLAIEKESYEPIYCLSIACKYGQIDLFKYIVENYDFSKEDLEYTLKVAFKHIRINIIRLFIEKALILLKQEHYPSDNDIYKIIEMAKLLAE